LESSYQWQTYTSTGSKEFLNLLGFMSCWAWAQIRLGLGLAGNIGLGCRSTTLNDLWGNEYSLYFNDVNSNTSFQHIVTGLMQPQWCNFNMSFIWCLFSLYELWTEIFNTSNVVDPSKTAKWSIKGATFYWLCLYERWKKVHKENNI